MFENELFVLINDMDIIISMLLSEHTKILEEAKLSNDDDFRRAVKKYDILIDRLVNNEFPNIYKWSTTYKD